MAAHLVDGKIMVHICLIIGFMTLAWLTVGPSNVTLYRNVDLLLCVALRYFVLIVFLTDIWCFVKLLMLCTEHHTHSIFRCENILYLKFLNCLTALGYVPCTSGSILLLAGFSLILQLAKCALCDTMSWYSQCSINRV